MTQSRDQCFDAAYAAARAGMLRFYGGDSGFDLINPRASGQSSFVFRAKIGDGLTVVVKIADPARMAVACARMIDMHAIMGEGRFRVPQLLHHDAATGLVVMEDARGQSAAQLSASGPKGLARALSFAGGWIARFHQTGSHMGRFNPDPHVNWLHKQEATHLDRSRHIPDFAAFQLALVRLKIAAQAVRGRAILRCVTHRDFHLRNLQIRNLGRTYGFDFENTKRDEALRDLLFFIADAAKLQSTDPSHEGLRQLAQPLRAAYRRDLGDAACLRAFQSAFALAGWASLDISQTPLGPNRARTLAVMQLLAETDDLWGDRA